MVGANDGMNRKRQVRKQRPLSAEMLEQRLVLSLTPHALVCDPHAPDLTTIPFHVTGGGPAPEGLPLFPGGIGPHFATGTATDVGDYDGAGFFELLSLNASMTGGTFQSPEPFIFQSGNGDEIAFHYGRTDFGAAGPGEFTIMPQIDGNIIVEFVAEFTLATEQSTGRFAKYTEGSFIMIATTDAFSPVPKPNGFTEAFDYTWVGDGSISFPTPHKVPFEVSGSGPAPDGLPLFPGPTARHFATGKATRVGSYDGAGSFELLSLNDTMTGGTFQSPEPFTFAAANGDRIAFHYGRTDFGAAGPGEFTVMPQSDGNVIIEFVAEFTLEPDESTGAFSKYTDGSFIMIATTEPFSPVPRPNGFTEPFDYSWAGEGYISFPKGTVYEVTNTNNDGDGSLRRAIAQANENEGIDTIQIGRRVRGEIPLSSELRFEDDTTLCGPGKHRLTVSGEQVTRVFRVDPVPNVPFGGPNGDSIAVEIHDLAIANGLATDAPGFPDAVFNNPEFDFGGGLFNRGNDVVLDSVKMWKNQAGTGGRDAAAGGAVANEFGGTLTVNRSDFSHNTAVSQNLGAGGAITQDVGPTADGLGTEPPWALVTHSRFGRNSATALETNVVAAGDFGPFAGFGLAGAIFNVAGDLEVESSQFDRNEANGGDGVDGNAGGTAIGGAILSLDFTPFIVPSPTVPPGRDANLNVYRSAFLRNLANGGDGDGNAAGGSGNGGAVAASIAFFPDSGSVKKSSFLWNSANGGDGGPNGGVGGNGVGGGVAVLAGASFDVGHSNFFRNTSNGGNGGSSAAGGEGRGGAIGLALLETAVPTDFELLIPRIDVHRGLFVSNHAGGGTGGNDAGVGGDGHGGAIGVTDGASATVSGVVVVRNRASGGRGGSRGGDGGNGQGGGFYNGSSTFFLIDSATLFNRAIGGDGRGGGSDGLGQGGGIFNSDSGTFTIDLASIARTRWNRADDDGDNVFGSLIVV